MSQQGMSAVDPRKNGESLDFDVSVYVDVLKNGRGGIQAEWNVRRVIC